MRIGLLTADPAWERTRGTYAGGDVLQHSMERQDRTVEAVRAALTESEHSAVDIRVDGGLVGRLGSARVDMVFNTYFGPGSRHDQPAVASLMEYAGVPFSGGGAACHYVGLSKPLTKRILVGEGLPTPRFVIAAGPRSADEVLRSAGIGYPVIVKPPGEGEGIGLDEGSVVHTAGELEAGCERIARDYGAAAVVEELMVGREFTVGVLDGDAPTVLPVLEIMVGRGEIFSYAVKSGERVEERCPALLSQAESARFGVLAIRAGRAVGCRDYWRVDIRMDGSEEPRILEVNTLPGLQPGYSDLARMVPASGMEYAEVIERIVQSTARRMRRERGVAR